METGGKKGIDAEHRRRRREYLIIGVTLAAVVTLTVLEVQISSLAKQLPIGNTILFFGLFNIDLVLILLLIFLVVRNLVKLFVERRRGILGSSLKTKLVLAFAGLTLIPTGVLFFVALKFINFSIEGWLDPEINQVFETSNAIVQSKYEDDAEKVLYFAGRIRDYIEEMELLGKERRVSLNEFLASKRQEYDLARVEVIWADGEDSIAASAENLPVRAQSLTPPANFLKNAFNGQEGYMITPMEGETDVIRGIVPLHEGGGEEGPVMAVLVAQTLLDKSLFGQMKENERSYQEYFNLKQMKSPIKNAHIILLVITSLLVLFSATWFGFHIAKTLVVPVERLAAATERVAAGDLHVTVEADAKDEMGVLARSFNRMTRELVNSQEELERAYETLERKNIEIDQRRKYMEIVLANVTAGVVSLDRDGCVTTINKAAEDMLRINVGQILGQNFRDVMAPEHLAIVDDLLGQMKERGESTVKRPINLTIAGTPVVLSVTLTELKDDEGELVGLVGVFEDTTQILQAQKVTAWREVARRIAHEIKNPLTPIQLNAERLRRNYMSRIEGDKTVFEEATDLIIKQVKELRELVDEFRLFARMPTAKPAPTDLNETVREAMGLFQEAHRHIRFSIDTDDAMPTLNIDREQIKRVMTNLFDNAVSAIDGRGRITARTSFIEPLQIARIEVSDTGAGIRPEDRRRVFEPDFSTKQGGSGLGLAIVQRIVSDHYGYIRVRHNRPKGTAFVIDLPTQPPQLGIAGISTGRKRSKPRKETALY